MQDKHAIRALMKRQKAELSVEEQRRQAEYVWQQVEASEVFRKAAVVLVFWSMDDEIDTHLFMARWRFKKILLLPVVVGETLELRCFEGEQALQRSAVFDVYEPQGAVFEHLRDIDLAIVPGIAFDRQNRRLGRGKGYYDRLLSQLEAYKIGVCFDFQMLDELPTEPHDIAMDEVVCPPNRHDPQLTVRQKAAALPELPGVYQFFNSEGTIIYVGKAKRLKQRVSSYFHKASDSPKVALMVRKIADLRTIVVESESEALFLENNLIKQYQPRYNIMLKDDKSYPWIVVRNEPFPRVYVMRNPVDDGSQYFGPYSAAHIVRAQLDLIKQLYQLRSCTLNLTDDQIQRGKFSVCLEHHIGNCKGPCVGLQSEDDYLTAIAQIKTILKGKISTVLQQYRAEMLDHAEHYRFEQAETVKKKIAILEKYQHRSTVVNQMTGEIDVFSYDEDVNCACINFLHIVDGLVVQAHNLELVKKLDEEPAELLSMAIADLRERFNSGAKEVIVPFEPDMKLAELTYTIPKVREKKHLLDLSLQNARHYLEDRQQQQERLDPERHENRVMETMQRDLHLSEPPRHIECFDNSNIQGAHPVASCVVFRNGRPSKKDYRHFNIKTVEGPNDFASMEEIIHRRYSRLLSEGAELPQLIIVDGGKGQLSAAVGSLQNLGLYGKIAIIGIAKRLEEIYFPGDSTPLYLDKRSVTLRIIQQLRDEAHRFGITFHRNKRSNAMLNSELNDIKGIGDKTIELLLKKFKSLAKIREASEEQLAEIIGKQKAHTLRDYFDN